MSQDRVLTLLYDKTFPKRPATANNGNNTIGINKMRSMGRFMSGGGSAGGNEDDFRQFNYYGQGAPNIEDFTEDDIAKLEKEVEELLRNRVTSAAALHPGMEEQQYQVGGIINIKSGTDLMSGANRVTKSA